MTDEQRKSLTKTAMSCTVAILEGSPTVTVSFNGPKRLPRFPRGELLSIGTNGSHNYAVCPIKVLAWIHSATMGGRAVEAVIAKEAP